MLISRGAPYWVSNSAHDVFHLAAFMLKYSTKTLFQRPPTYCRGRGLEITVLAAVLLPKCLYGLG